MKQRILVLFGGESSEHDVSIASARNVTNALDRDRYEIHLCYITREGNWALADDIESLVSEVELHPVLGDSTLQTSRGDKLEIDVVFPVLHGAHGEDGDVQGLANLLHLPCVGPSLIGAAITMDKDVTKRLLRDAGVPVVDWLCWRTADERPSYEGTIQKLGDTLFVKPANAGSSVGVSKVIDDKTFQDALAEAAEHDSLVLIERAIDAREIELAVLGNETLEVTVGGEIIPGAEFYDYDDKYSTSSTAQVKLPAELDESTVNRLKQYAATACLATRSSGMARVDFLLGKDGDIYLNEINSIPGFTDISMYPKLWQHEGLAYPELLDRLISLALEK